MQLDDACRRTLDKVGIGGCMLLLSVWSWEHFPVGRPKEVTHNDWNVDDPNPLRLPTWAYKWDVVSDNYSDIKYMYKQYTNEFDMLTAEQVSTCLYMTLAS